MKFVGRTEQLGQLMALWNKATSSLVTCQGRRRIGKSRLMDEFAARSGCFYLKLAGLAPRKGMTNADQLRYFCQRLGEFSRGGAFLLARAHALGNVRSRMSRITPRSTFV